MHTGSHARGARAHADTWRAHTCPAASLTRPAPACLWPRHPRRARRPTHSVARTATSRRRRRHSTLLSACTQQSPAATSCHAPCAAHQRWRTLLRAALEGGRAARGRSLSFDQRRVDDTKQRDHTCMGIVAVRSLRCAPRSAAERCPPLAPWPADACRVQQPHRRPSQVHAHAVFCAAWARDARRLHPGRRLVEGAVRRRGAAAGCREGSER